MGVGQIRKYLRRGARARWALARALVCLAAPLLFVAFQLPWVVFTSMANSGTGPAPANTESLSGNFLPVLLALRFSTPGRPGFDSILYWAGLVWHSVPVIALLLALALWQRTSAQVALVMQWAFRVWLVVMTLLGLLSLWLIHDALSLAGRSNRIQIESLEVGAGVWLALAALAVLWIGMYLMVGEARLPERADRLAAIRGWRRTRAQLVALGLLLAGLVLWSLGYLALPWATANCAPHLSLTHYVDGPCAGLDSGDTLMAFVSPHLSSSTFVSIFASDALLLAYVLVFGAAFLLLAGASRRAYTRGFCGWVLAWLVAATAMALLSYRGVSSAVASPPFAVGSWHGDLGIVLTFAGLLCAWASLIPLEAAGLAQAAMEAAATSEAASAAPSAQAPA